MRATPVTEFMCARVCASVRPPPIRACVPQHDNQASDKGEQKVATSGEKQDERLVMVRRTVSAACSVSHPVTVC